MTTPKITEATIRQYATDKSFWRGKDYYDSGAVISLARRGEQIEAEVEGSQYEPYRVTVDLDAGGIASAYCTCPYDWGGYCKHIVAVLLTYCHESAEIEERPTLEALLADLNREQLQTVLLNLVKHHPKLMDAIESQVQIVSAATMPEDEAAPRHRRTSINPEAFRRQVHYTLHSVDYMSSSEAYWREGEIIDSLRQMLDQVRDFVEAGDGHTAMIILEAITDEYTKDWMYLDGSSGETGGFFYDLAELWAEAILSAELTRDERREWFEKITRWRKEQSDYGIEDFAMVAAAVEQGWDYPPLQRAMRGEITEKGAWEDEAPWYADDLATARLNVLERQERYAEYLNLAEAEGQTTRYVTMLARLGRIAEVVEYGLRYLATANEALALAKSLREREEFDAALRIAEHGLSLHPPRVQLATWLRDVALSMERSELALNAAIVAFREYPSLTDYQTIASLSSEKWHELREQLLAYLRQTTTYHTHAQVEIFLHENLIDDAIAVVSQNLYDYNALEMVVDAATESHPDWVIDACRKQAEPIMDQGKSKHYNHALRWLKKARAAYLAAGRAAEWREYIEGLISKHYRKYTLRPGLEELR